jgi:hypothetical protein
MASGFEDYYLDRLLTLLVANSYAAMAIHKSSCPPRLQSPLLQGLRFLAR